MEINSIFSNHMVLQARKPIRIFGNGCGTVSCKIAGLFSENTFNTNEWVLELPALQYGGPYVLEVCLNGKKTVFEDVYIGEVILLAGQSNMEFPLGKSIYPAGKYEDNALLRCFAPERFDKNGFFKPHNGWNICKKEAADHWYALGYHIGIEMTKEYNVAVGMIFCSFGASSILTWLPEEIATAEQFYLPPEEKYDSPYAKMPHNNPGTLYHFMQQTFVPFVLGNVVWYQGESNSGSGEWKIYTELLKALIDRWRLDFQDEKLRFTVVQIANWDNRDDDAWHGIQRAQERIVNCVENVKLVKSCDLCETNDIHPPTKFYLAKRIYESLKQDIFQRCLH